MTAVPDLLAPIREREQVACDYPDHATVEQSQADIPRLLAAIDGVLALHKPFEYHGQVICDHCFDEENERERLYPCPTVAAVVAALQEGQ